MHFLNSLATFIGWVILAPFITIGFMYLLVLAVQVYRGLRGA